MLSVSLALVLSLTMLPGEGQTWYGLVPESLHVQHAFCSSLEPFVLFAAAVVLLMLFLIE